MKQNIFLYIDGARADLNDDALILFTYSAEDTENPSVVVNTYTKSVTLPATPANNKIFDHINNATHNVRGGAFSPIVRTPFEIYAETGERLESGYLKLDTITKDAYVVTLYGGLGGLLYGLLYDGNGQERTLASLPFDAPTLPTPLTDADIAFNVNITEVGNAWKWLCLATASDNRWKVFNFAPMYNSTPDSFDAKKIICGYRSVPNVTLSGIDGYTPANTETGDATKGEVLVTLPEPTTEWRVRDLRSYLQRPVVNVQKLLDVIKADAAASGYALTYENAVYNSFADLWLSLPMLTTSIKATGKGGHATISPASVTLQYGIAGGSISFSVSSSTSSREEVVKVTAEITFTGSFTNGADYRLTDGSNSAFYLLQLIASDGSGHIAGSKIVSCSDNGAFTASLIATAKAAGVNPLSGFVDEDNNAGDAFSVYPHATSASSATLYDADTNAPLSLSLTCSAFNPTAWTLRVQRFMAGYPSDYDEFYALDGTAVQVRQVNTASGSVDWTEHGVLSGSLVTKENLLGASPSPCAFLLSLVRLYGLKLNYTPASRTMEVMRRNSYYGAGVVDLEGRIDRAQELNAKPYVFDHRFFEWGQQPAGQTAKASAKPYGAKIIDTSFPFDNETENVLEGVPLKTAADVLDRDVEYNLVSKGSYKFPPAYLKGGAKFSLYNAADPSSTSKSFDAATLDAFYSVTPLLSRFPSYDHYPKSDLRGDDAFVLLRYAGRANGSAYGYLTTNLWLSDDTPTMLALNAGVPCWRFEDAQEGRRAGITDNNPHTTGTLPLPLFGRITGAWSVNAWVASGVLEMAIPEEIDIPSVDTSGLSSLYDKAWQLFVTDRYDVDTRVLECRVFWRGLPVSGEALRKIYTFDGCLWCLVKIEDYSLTTEEPTKCTFVKIKNKSNYTNGQTL